MLIVLKKNIIKRDKTSRELDHVCFKNRWNYKIELEKAAIDVRKDKVIKETIINIEVKAHESLHRQIWWPIKSTKDRAIAKINSAQGVISKTSIVKIERK